MKTQETKKVEKFSSQHIIDRLIALNTLKDTDGFNGKLKKWVEKSQLKIGKKDAQQSDYRTFTSRAVSDQQSADLLHNMPIFDYIPLSDKAIGKIFYLKELWKYAWKTDETDRKILEVVEDATDLGSGILYSGWKLEKRNVKLPKYDDGSLSWEAEERIEYFGTYTEFIPIENFFADGTTLENSNETMWIRFWDRGEFKKAHELNDQYNVSSIPNLQLYLDTYKKLPKLNDINAEDDIVQEIRYYNRSEDRLIILANGEKVYDTPIPHTHKDHPFTKFDNHKYRDRFIQMGNYEMMEEPERYIDAIRSQTVDVTKVNIGFNAVPKDSDFNPTITKVGAFSFVEMEEPSEIKHIGNNIQTSGLSELETKAANDVIALTGIDYKQQILSSSGETALKTSSKNTAQLKRTNKLLKKNSFNFYNRLAKLRLADLQFINSIDESKLPIEGYNQKKDGSFDRVQNGYGLFTVPKKAIDEKFDIVLQTESLLGNSTEKDKENWLNFFQVFGDLKDENEKKIINQTRMVEVAGNKLGINVDILTQKEEINKDGKSIVEEMKALKSGKDLNANNPSNPNFIPGANKANSAGGINVIGGGNTNSGENG